MRFGLYVHWPFCTSKCPYCDFNSHVAKAVDHAAWRAALLSELRRVAPEFAGQGLGSVFFGGGTPSLMEPATVAAVLDAAAGLFALADDIEVTLEANPGSTEMARMAAFRDAGVNRVSIGVQALDDAGLRRLGRTHTAADARAAVDVAARQFSRFSFDLIYGRQDQTEADWEAELRRALSFAGDHLSLYQLTIEDGTVFGARQAAGQLRGLPDDERGAVMFETTGALCEAAGLRRYEVSNYARPDQASRHNLIYWRGGDYAGIGPGAHGRHRAEDGARIATTAIRAPDAWIAAARRGNAEAERLRLSEAERRDERLVMGLRLTEGLPLAAIGLDRDTDVLRAGVADGWLWATADRVGATPGGLLLLDRVIAEIGHALDQKDRSAVLA